MIEVITAACSHDLTTVKNIVERIGAVDSSKETQLITLIKSASQYIERYTGRVFAQEKVKETLPAYGTTRIMLSRTPIVSIDSIVFNGSTISDYVIEDASAGILYSKYGWLNTSLASNTITGHPLPNSAEPLYEVTYTGGYILPSMDETTRDMPYDLEEAVSNLIRDQLDRASGNIKSVRVGDYSVTYGTPDGGSQTIVSLNSINSILDQYRRLDL